MVKKLTSHLLLERSVSEWIALLIVLLLNPLGFGGRWQRNISTGEMVVELPHSIEYILPSIITKKKTVDMDCYWPKYVFTGISFQFHFKINNRPCIKKPNSLYN